MKLRQVKCYFIPFFGRSICKKIVRNGMFEGKPQRDVFNNYKVPFKKIGKLIIPSKSEIKLIIEPKCKN